MKIKRKIAIILIVIFVALVVWAVFSLDKKEVVENELIIVDLETNQIIESPLEISRGSVLLNVPFILQAPFANWDNPVFQDACEEAAILMVKYWLLGKDITKQEAYDEIIVLADFEEKNYKGFYDHSAKDTAEIMREYIGYNDIFVKDNIDIDDIKKELDKGNLVVVPVNGQAINNPNYTAPGPERHMIVIIGYDEGKFITNDSGTRKGENYMYSEDILFWSIRDYPSGHKEPIVGIKKSMIVIESNL